MLAAMHSVVADRSEELTQPSLEEVLPAVRTRWRLDEPVISELAATPEFAAIPPETLQAVAGLAGIAYPFPTALRQRAGEPAGAGRRGPRGHPGGGAQARRRALCAAGGRAGGRRLRLQRDAPAELAGLRLLSVLELAAGGGGACAWTSTSSAASPSTGWRSAATRELRYAPQWTDAAATFIASAHRHQAKVDLGIRLRDWREWDEDQVRSAARFVLDELTPLAAARQAGDVRRAPRLARPLVRPARRTASR